MTEKRMIRIAASALSVLIVLAACLVGISGSSLGQPGRDSGKAEKELEIMKSVISTTISMTKQRLAEEREEGEDYRSRYQRYMVDFNENAIDGYYLHGQGVVFTIPFPCESAGFSLNLERELARLDEAGLEHSLDIEEMEQEIEMLVTEVELQRQELGLPHAVPPPPPPFSAPEAPAEPEIPETELSGPELAGKKEALARARENVEKAVARVRVRMKEAQEKSSQLEEMAAAEKEAIKEELINVLASHGGSLTQVKNGEFINLVLEESCEPLGWRNRNSKRTVLSVRKDDIIAHLTGQISLDELEAKIVEY